jgi:outer membrane protein
MTRNIRYSSYKSRSKNQVLRYFILCSFFCFGHVGLYAQRLLTLEEAIATALQNNYDIQLSRNDSAVAALDYSFRNAVFLPRLNATAGTNWNKNNQQQKFSSGMEREGNVNTNNLTGGVTLNWTLFDGLKMFATRQKAEEFIRLGELGIKNQIVNTVATVITNYYDIVRQKQQLRAVEEQMSINEERVKLAQYKLDIGTGAKPDLLQSKVDLNAQRAAQLNQRTLITKLKEQLNQTMNVAPGVNYEVSDSIPLKEAQLAIADIQNDIEKTNPQLQIAKKTIDIANLTLKERKAERWPLVSFNSSYNFSKNKNDVTLNPALPLTNQNRGYNYGFSASIPILNNLNTRRLVRQAELDIQYQQLVYESQRSVINLNVMNAYQDYLAQQTALALEEENIVLAKENVNIIFETYRLGGATYIQLREAQNSLETAYNRLISARYNTKLAETELLRLKGDLLR